jgi:hypothetical protein
LLNPAVWHPQAKRMVYGKPPFASRMYWDQEPQQCPPPYVGGYEVAPILWPNVNSHHHRNR